MQRPRLVLGVAAVLAGIAVLLATLGVVYNLFILVAAAPFGLTAFVLWYQATGRLGRRARRRAAGAAARDGRAARGGRGGFGAGSRADWTGPRGPYADADGARADAGGGRDRRRSPGVDGPSDAEAYRILGVEAGAGPAAIRTAYREKVKEVHPDSGGSEEAFKRVTAAYERLTDDRSGP